MKSIFLFIFLYLSQYKEGLVYSKYLEIFCLPNYSETFLKIFSVTNSAFVGLTNAYNSAEVTTLGTALAKFVHNNCNGSSCQTANCERRPDFTNEKL